MADGNLYNAAYLVVLAVALSTAVWYLHRNHHVLIGTLSLLVVIAFGPRAAYLNISGGIGTAAAAPAQSTPAATASTNLGPDDAAAVVNDQPIKMSELTKQVNLNLAFLRLNGTPEHALKGQVDQIRAGLIGQIAEQRLVWQAAQKGGIFGIWSLITGPNSI